MGDAMMPTQKLINRILTLEFIKMQELLPENWPDFLSEDANKFYTTFGKKKAPHVTNILIHGWSVIVHWSPFYHQPTLNTSRNLCRKSATSNLKALAGVSMIGHTGVMQLPPRAYFWSKPDITLFNFLTLAGRAKKQPSCFSSNHDSTHCPEAFFFQNPLGSLSLQLLPQMLMPHAATASNQQVRPICGNMFIYALYARVITLVLSASSHRQNASSLLRISKL